MTARRIPATAVRIGDIIDDDRFPHVCQVGHIAMGRQFVTFRPYHPDANVRPNPPCRVPIGESVTIYEPALPVSISAREAAAIVRALDLARGSDNPLSPVETDELVKRLGGREWAAEVWAR